MDADIAFSHMIASASISFELPCFSQLSSGFASVLCTLRSFIYSATETRRNFLAASVVRLLNGVVNRSARLLCRVVDYLLKVTSTVFSSLAPIHYGTVNVRFNFRFSLEQSLAVAHCGFRWRFVSAAWRVFWSFSFLCLASFCRAVVLSRLFDPGVLSLHPSPFISCVLFSQPLSSLSLSLCISIYPIIYYRSSILSALAEIK